MRERRRATRVPARLAMEIKLSGRDLAKAESINVSANGVYFYSDVYIEPLTKLQITLLLPSSSTPSSSSNKVACEGVVVRTEPEEKQEGLNRYDIACYFTSIPDEDREILETYILRQLTF